MAFFGSREAKTAIDLHHAQIAQAIKWYVKLGFEVKSGDDIENAIKDIAGTRVEIQVLKIGIWKEYSPDKIEKIVKKRKFEKPNPSYTQHTEPSKLWTTPIVDKPGEIDNIFSCTIFKVATNLYKPFYYRIFFSGWALKENKKTRTREPVKRMTREIKHLLEIMFHTGTANPRQKMNTQQMHEELLQRAQQGELCEEDVPKISII
ncbi:unnamed protein product [Rhizophagus irregularis]|nr:unnamed protein product [Rhizophagus irregularis]